MKHQILIGFLTGALALFAVACGSTSDGEGSSQGSRPGCDPAYPTVCIPSKPPDLDCGEISFRRFKVLPPDPHGFDGDNDGIGCES